MTRSRRAGLSRDEVRQQPLYARLLGLQYLAPGGFLCFVFLEGAVALGILLALAELVSWWGVLVLPAMVAVMVKLNDVVAGMLMRPGMGSGASPGAPFGASGTSSGASPGATLSGASAGTPSGASPRTSLPGASPGASPGAETVRLSPAVIAQAGEPPPALRPAAVPRSSAPVASAGSLAERHGAPVMDASALNGPPVTRQWTDDLDDREQRARQSAARRYE
jgi:hypothetical protein